MTAAAIALLSLIYTWTLLRDAGMDLAGWEISTLALAVLAALLFSRRQAPPPGRLMTEALWALPVWVALSLVPLPTALLRLVSPARAAIHSAVAAILPGAGRAALSFDPAATLSGWLHLAGYLLVFLIVRELAWRASEFHPPWILALPLVVVAALQAVLGLVQFYTGASPNAHGTYVNYDHFAGLLEMALPFPALYGIVALWRRRVLVSPSLRAALLPAAAFATAALLLAASVHSLSRMGFLCALTALAAAGALTLRRKRWLLAAPILAALLVVYLPPGALIERFSELFSSSGISSQDRLTIWRETLPMVAPNLAAGTGLGSYESAFMLYKRSTPTATDTYAHNDYLQYLVELGLPGFLCGLLLVAASLRAALLTALRHTSPAGQALGAACAASLIALLLHSTVDFNSYIPANAFAFAWIAGLAHSAMFSSRPSAPPPGGTVLNARFTAVSS